jgi:preprotein translocase subunit SecY
MLSTIKDAWKIPDLRKKIFYTLLLLAVFRLGSHIPVPGINTDALVQMTNQGNLLGFYDLISGGAFSRFSILALGVNPYINASIIVQLLTVAVPYLEQLSKEGEEGRKKIQQYTRYLAMVLGIVLAYGSYLMIVKFGALTNPSILNIILIIVTLVSGATFSIWLGDQLTVKGIGNGMSLLIFINIVSRMPSTARQLAGLAQAETVDYVQLVLFALFVVALLISIVVMSLSERRISVQYAGKTVGNKSFKGQSTHMPFTLTSTAVIAIIFAMSVMQFPNTIGQFMSKTSWFNTVFVGGQYSPFKSNSWIYSIVYAVLVIFFSWFYAQITFKPEEMAENMHKSSGFIPGIRPGQSTALYIEKILTRVALIGGTFAALVAILPILIEGYTKFKGISFGGTSLFIMISVALETVRQIESQLVTRHYKGFLK